MEKARYPQYEHVAVIVAEDITSRFLNVINLFNKSIPLIAIQMRALDVGGVLTLSATTVLDIQRLGTDEEDEPGQATDRMYWLTRGSPASIEAVDALVALVNEVSPGLAPKYNKHYIGLARDGVPDNFLSFRARKDFVTAVFKIPRGDELTAIIDDSGLDSPPYDKHWGGYRIRLTAGEVKANRELLLDLIRPAAGQPAPISE